MLLHPQEEQCDMAHSIQLNCLNGHEHRIYNDNRVKIGFGLSFRLIFRYGLEFSLECWLGLHLPSFTVLNDFNAFQGVE